MFIAQIFVINENHCNDRSLKLFIHFANEKKTNFSVYKVLNRLITRT